MDTKLLKQKILDLAIRGKLVPQDPNDEPASVLLERIRAEREKLIAEGKLKRTKTTTDNRHYENVPFEVPESWKWVKLSEIAFFGGGKTPSMAKKAYWQNGNNLWVTSKDMKSDRICDSKLKISDEALSIMTVYEPGTLLLVTRSGILKHSMPLAILEKKATVNQDIKTISLFVSELNEFVYYSIKARESFILKDYHKDGTTVDSIDFDKLSNILLPIPPLNEQIRIVKMIERLFSSIDELKQNKTDIQDIVKQTKTKILNLAIHGKLVEQDPNDEPASELLKRIAPNAVIGDSSHYRTIPNSWIMCQLIDVVDLLDNKRKPIKAEERAKRIDGKKALYPYYGATGFVDYIDEYLVDGRFILLGEDGAPFLDKFATKAYEVKGQIWVNNHAHILSPKIHFEYLLFYMNAIDYAPYVKGTTRLKLTQSDMNRISILLPPLNEQIRISRRIAEIFESIDLINKGL